MALQNINNTSLAPPRSSFMSLLTTTYNHFVRNPISHAMPSVERAIYTAAQYSVKTAVALPGAVLPTQAAKVSYTIGNALLQERALLEAQKTAAELERRNAFISRRNTFVNDLNYFAEYTKVKNASFMERNDLFKFWREFLELFSRDQCSSSTINNTCMITGQIAIFPIKISISESEQNLLYFKPVCPRESRFEKYQSDPQDGFCFDLYSFLVYCIENHKFPWEISRQYKQNDFDNAVQSILQYQQFLHIATQEFYPMWGDHF